MPKDGEQIRVCTKCRTSRGPFGKKKDGSLKARCNPCLAEDQQAYVAKQDKNNYQDKHRQHNKTYLKNLAAKGLKRKTGHPVGYAKGRWQALRQKILDKYGRVCAKCGFSDCRALQVDHVHGGGSKERRSKSSNHAYYKKVLEDATGKFQLLCANCNWIKRFESGEDNL